MISIFCIHNILGFLFLQVNVIHDENLSGNATMGANPQRLDWSANRAVDGNINQDYTSGSCAITNIDVNRNTSIWWKVWLERPFNIAYLEIYFEKNSKLNERK